MVNNFTNRYPVDNYEFEQERTDSYWEWLSENIVQDNSEIVFKNHNIVWKQLKNSDDADYEALYMRHSIGHSWNKYSSYGDIYSLRDSFNIPQVTILVIDNKVVHAREERNARLSKESSNYLKEFCGYFNILIQEEEYPFEVYLNQEGNNTKIQYLYRGPNKKEFKEAILYGNIDEVCARNFPLIFNPKDYGIPGEINCEIISISSTTDPAQSGMSIYGIIDYLNERKIKPI